MSLDLTFRAPSLLLAVLLPLPAHAADASQLPDPNSLSLLALGVAGVLLGRRISRKRSGD